MNKSKVKPSKPTIPPHATGNCSSPASRTTPPSKSKSEKDVPYEGIYQNLRFCETITSLMGNTVQIQLSNGKIFEGIFSTFSPQLEVVLELVHTVDPNHPDKIDIKSVSREVVFGSQLIVTMSSKDVELDYATKDSFATDNSISRFNGLMGEKELEPWVGDEDDCHISLDDANGWDPNEMFARNEKVYGVQSDFEQDLSQYTYKLEKKDSKEYKDLEARASKLANIIESSTSSKVQTELENASDEEEKFSAVIRPSHDSRDRSHDNREFREFNRSDRGSVGAVGASSLNSAGGKYVHPNKRPNKGIQSMNKTMRSTPPPHVHSHSHSSLAPRHQSGGAGSGSGGSGTYHGSNYEGDRGSHSSHSSPGPTHHGYHQQQQGGSQHQAFQPSQGRGSGGPYYGHGQNRSQGQSTNYNHKVTTQQQQPGEARLNGEDRKGNREPQTYDSKSTHAPPHHQQHPQQQQQVLSAQLRDHPPKEQRKSYASKNREDQSLELKKFGHDFRLVDAVTDDKKPVSTALPSTVSTLVQHSQPAVPATATAAVVVVNSNSTNSPPAVAIASPVAPQTVQAAFQPPAPLPTVVTVAPVTSPAIQLVVTNTTVTTVSPTSAMVQEVAIGGVATVAVEEKPSELVDKVSETLKKSNLNPNAKEFVLNPNARVFVPTPPRSHTPQTPQGGQILVPTPMGTLGPVGPGLAGSGSPGQGISLMPVVHYVTNPNQNQGPASGANQPHFQQHNPTGTRFRKPAPMPVNHRPDLTSSMHVAAATGQPLMAPAPMGGPQLFYPPQGAIIPGTPQPYTQLYTMRVVAPGMQGMVPTSVFGESPSSGQGPIYMSPGHGQGVNNQGQMAPPQPQQHHHPNSTPSPAQQHSMAQTPTGNPPQQLIYQTAGGHHGHTPGPPHNHPHASFPMVFLPPGHTTLPPGVAGPNGGPQGVQILPLGSSSAGMAAMGMMPQIHYIQQAPGNQTIHRHV